MRRKLNILFVLLLIISTVQCEDKPTENEEDISKTGLKLEHEIVNKEQSDQPGSGESFVAIHKNAKNIGAVEELRPTLRSVSYMASSFLPAKYTLIGVISATREVVAGVRYNLLLNANDNDEQTTVVCALEIFEKPWLTNEWGQKYKKLEYSNCTDTDSVASTPVSTIDEKADAYDVNPVFKDRNSDMTEERLKDLEDQVITSFMKPSKKKFPKISAVLSTTTTVAPEIVTDLSDASQDFLDQMFIHGTFGDNNQANIVKKEVDALNHEGEPEKQEVVEEMIVPKKVTKVWEEEGDHILLSIPSEKSDENVIKSDEHLPVGQASEEDDSLKQEVVPYESDIERALDEIFQSHLEVQENLDDMALHAIQIDEPEEKFEPVFGVLEDQLSTFMSNFYQKYGIEDDNFHAGPPMSPYGPYDLPFIDVQSPLIKPKITGATAYFDSGRQIVEEPNFFINDDDDDLQQRQIPNTAEEIFDQSEIKNMLKRATKPDDSSNSSEDMKKLVDKLATDLNKPLQNGSSETSSSEEKKTVRVRRTTAPVHTVPSDKMVKSDVWKYTQKALAQLDHADSDEYKRVLLNIVFAKKLKKTADELTFIAKVRTGNSHCVEEFESVKESCKTNLVTGSNRICFMEIKVRQNDDVQVPKAECAPEMSADEKPNCPGCATGTSPEMAAEIEVMLSNAITLLNAQEDDAELKLLRIVSSTKQVVAGMKYVIDAEFSNKGASEVTNCKVSIWDRPWLENGREINFECDENKKYTINKQHDRKKRAINNKSGPCVGCPQDTTTSEAAEMANIVHEELLKLKGQADGTELKLKRVISTQKQVVAGYKYTVVGEFTNAAATEVHNCTVSIWERPWIPNSRETNFDCGENKKFKVTQQAQLKRRSPADEATPPCVGCPIATDPTEATNIVKLVNEEMVKLNAQETGVSLALTKVVSSTQQVVAGTKYVINAEFSNKGATEVFKCIITIWDRPWLPNGRETTFECDQNQKFTLNKQRTKRSMPFRQQYEIEETKEEQKVRHTFAKFRMRHSKNYANAMEENIRYRIFKNNLFKIDQLNRHEQGTAKYGITEFADLTLSEYRQITGLLPVHERDNAHENEISHVTAEIPNIELPTSFDWREKNAVTEVKNQGNCGSCWAFSVVGNIEGLNAIKTGNLEEFSEQELLDCDTIDKACGGGFMDQAYKALEQLGGLELESDYPYEAKKEPTCNFNKTKSHVAVSGAVDLPKNETAMAQWLVANGPISIGVNANAMQFYRGGVSHPWSPLCSKKQLDHGVLIVGYGIKEYPMFKKSLPYWIIKNSWGPKWGEQGYYRLYRGDNSCGVTEMASSAVLA